MRLEEKYNTNLDIVMINQEIINSVWNRASEVEGRDRDVWRRDPCGALIRHEDYGNRSSDFGWEIDHVVSKAYLLKAGASEEEIDNPENLRAMHWANNDSKGTNYPEYKVVRKEKEGKNVEVEVFLTVNAKRQKELKRIFSRFGL